jgi:catechol 2,3-dioxygenase-like lactoylglutathione lyase family enzyme
MRRGASRPSARDTLGRVGEEVIPVLYIEDAARAVAWYQRLGFHQQWEHQFEPGFPWFVSVARGHVRLYLSEHKGDARPDMLIHLNVTCISANHWARQAQINGLEQRLNSRAAGAGLRTACA